MKKTTVRLIWLAVAVSAIGSLLWMIRLGHIRWPERKDAAPVVLLNSIPLERNDYQDRALHTLNISNIKVDGTNGIITSITIYFSHN